MNAKPPLGYSAHARALLALGVPLVASHLAQMLLHVTDTVMLGWYGVTELAAVVLGSSAFFIVFILGSGFGIAVMGLVASALGAGDTTQVRRDTRMGLWLSIGYGLAVMPLMWWSGPILLAAGQKPEVAALAQDYLRIAGFGMVPALVILSLKSYLAAFERTQVVLAVTLVSVGVNAALNWALIFGHWGAPELGVQGAAIATLTVQLIGAAMLAGFAGWLPELRHVPAVPPLLAPRLAGDGQGVPHRPADRPDRPRRGRAVQASALMMGWLGRRRWPHTASRSNSRRSPSWCIWGCRTLPRCGWAAPMGARDARALRDAAATAVAMSLALRWRRWCCSSPFPKRWWRCFSIPPSPAPPKSSRSAAQLLAVAALFQMFDAMQVMALGLLRGVQDIRAPMWLASISYWLIGIPASYVLAFPLGFGGVGLCAGAGGGPRCRCERF